MRIAYVYKLRSGYWVAVVDKTGERIGGLYDTELDAYKAAARAGYVVR